MICDSCKEVIKEGTTVYSTEENIPGVSRSATHPNITNLGLECAMSLGALPEELVVRVLSGELR